MNTKLRSVLAALIGLSLAMPGLTAADHYGHGYKYKHGYKHGHKKHHRHQHRRHHGGTAHYGGPIPHYYKNRNSPEKLLIGLLVGGLAGYVISNAQKRPAYGYPPQPAYTYTPSYPSAQPAAVYPPKTVQSASAVCLQEREYQTTVVVGGNSVPAYGRACLQPDGSWRHGPARPVVY